MARGEELNFIQKRFLVQRLACFEKPSAVAKAFKEEFGFELQLNRVTYYDPTTKAGAALADELKTIFFETRKANLADLDGIKIFHKAHQLRALDRALDLAESKGHVAMVIPLVEAAAKIAGTVVSKHELTGKDGKDLPAAPAAVVTIIKIPDNGREAFPVGMDPEEASRVYMRMVRGYDN
jgi:hypothetical protein